MKKLTFNFHNIDTVTGYCHDCQEDSILVAIVSEFYRCTNCGADEEVKLMQDKNIKWTQSKIIKN